MKMDRKSGVALLFTLGMLDVVKGIPCGYPGKIPHGSTKYLKGGMLVQFFCDPGYEPLGPPMLSCLRGKWKGKRPICVAPGCPYVLQPFNAYKSEQMKGAVVTFRCRTGFRINGESLIYCDGLKWSAPFPTCEGKNRPSPAIEPLPEITAVKDGPSANARENGKPVLVQENKRPVMTQENSRPAISQENNRPTEAQKNSRPVMTPLGRPYNPYPNPYMPSLQPTRHYNPYQNIYNPYGPPVMSTGGQSSQYQRNPYGQPRYYPQHYVPVQTGTAMGSIYSSREEQNPMQWPRSRIQEPQTPGGEESQPYGRGKDGGAKSDSAIDRTKSTVDENVVRSVPQLIQNQNPISRFTSKEDRVISESTTSIETEEDNDYRVQTSMFVVPGISEVAIPSEEKTTSGVGSHRSCPPAPRPINGYHITRPLPRDFDTDKYLYLIEYRCNPGLNMIGNNMSYCMTNGKWSAKRPRCELMSTGGQASQYQQNSYGLPRYYPQQYVPVQTGTAMRPIYLQREEQNPVQWDRSRIQEPRTPGDAESQLFGGIKDGGAKSGSAIDRTKATVDGNVVRSVPQLIQNRNPISRFPSKENGVISESTTSHKTKEDNDYSVKTSMFVVPGISQVAIPSEEKTTTDVGPHRSCPPAPRPINGYHITRPLPRDFDTDKYLYLIEYRCNPGLKMIGNNMSYCMTNGKWSAKRPRCEQIHTCEPGFTMQRNHQCVDVNECAKNNGGCPQTCQNYPGGFFCTCDPGYRQAPDEVSCTDIDECDTAEEQLCNHNCHNTVGSFSCSCRNGYSLMEHDNRTCLDINECLASSPCQHLCQNTFGSFRCACKINFRLNDDGQTCSEICKPGYKMQFDEENNVKSCVDENECLEHGGLGSCEQVCTNNAGSYVCSCSPGYKLNEDHQTCSDMDECENEDYPPCEYGCINTVGSFECSCPEDQVLSEDKLLCVGCVTNMYMRNSECINCPQYAVTENSGATSLNECVCTAGYGGSPELGIPCTDVNECEDDNYGCSHECINTLGSVFCRCPDGFRLLPDGRNCQDVDECTQRLGVCGRGGSCRNTDGGYNCTCTRGYRPDFRNSNICVDINECETGNGGCQMRCHNLQPGYRCSCNPDWHLNRDGRRCSPLRGACPRLEPLLNGRILPEAPCVHYGTVLIDRYCLYACNGGYKRLGNDRRKCGPDGWTGSPPTCVPAAWCPVLRIPDGVKVTPPACASNTNMPWMLCVFSCKNPSHKIIGSRTTRCSRNRRWTTEPPSCVPRSEIEETPETPRIQCPRDIDVDLAPGKALAEVTLPNPDSNVEVTSQKNDGSSSRDVFPAGTTSVKFTAGSTEGERQVSCVMRVHVRDKEAPVIQSCPGSISIESRHRYPKMAWNPPLFSDNVKVETIKESRFPQGNITWGSYSISYTASDAAGNMAECAFSLSITRPKNSAQSVALSCGRPQGPANGRAECQSWARGVYCIPICNPSFAFERKPPTYMCDGHGVWSPGKVIPDCVDVRSANSKRPVSSTGPSLKTPLTTVTMTEAFTSTTTTSASTSKSTTTLRTTLPSPTVISKLKFLEKPDFHLVSTEQTKITSRERVVVHNAVPIREQHSNFVHRASRPRLVKLAPLENDCSTGHVPKSDENGQIMCERCARGTYRPRVKSAIKCLPCSIGFYQDRPGMGYCKRCPNYTPHASVYSMQGKEKFKGLKSAKECERIRIAEEANIRDSAVRRALDRRSRLLHHR